ncbi:hypothetical protein A2803_02745 [Candidatus Woesebacteria bacterium RIFCSPHIGHO2_01_FULL_44_21]|uniref:NodB homology domain-containing protein n=1 Tax=Candidatus Woesebacteria bacterium RIFCSPHIGHO2_01_FULL_44_21 TaxID=1802503 RepID=A0A1F7YXD0_9BACT|nr:MAG: hypothetical protein A2803_02745 [Candidatus Woesebacteria bacterium RIFCSPHIGHO2_01_FULL_44_21]OGM69809.1 MAG: hypothetical protein A2897_00500 [Candidatus Woesebacteria bacterium RIFCSPLOWO2_01_FULL_44_24b]
MARKKLNRAYTNLLWLVIPMAVFALFAKYLVTESPIEKYEDDTLSLKSGEPSKPVISEYNWHGEALVTFWFDDGWRSQYSEGFRILDNYGYKAALAVPIEPIGYEAYMNWHQIRKLHYLGWEIASHSRSHDCDLVYKGEPAFEYEIFGGKQDLENYGILTDIYVAPCGENTPEATEYVKRHFLSQRIVEPGLNPLPVTDNYGLMVKQVSRDIDIEEIKGWINEAISKKQWIILMLHQIDDEDTEYGTTPDNLEQVVDFVNHSNISVVLPSQALGVERRNE